MDQGSTRSTLCKDLIILADLGSHRLDETLSEQDPSIRFIPRRFAEEDVRFVLSFEDEIN